MTHTYPRSKPVSSVRSRTKQLASRTFAFVLVSTGESLFGVRLCVYACVGLSGPGLRGADGQAQPPPPTRVCIPREQLLQPLVGRPWAFMHAVSSDNCGKQPSAPRDFKEIHQ